MSEQAVGIEWGIEDDAERQRAIEIARDEGADVEIEEGGTGFFPLIPVIVGAMLVVKLAGMVYRFVQDLREGGLVIDARETPIKIRHDKSIDRGKIVVINAKGETTTSVDATTKDDLADLIKNATTAGATGAASTTSGTATTG